MNFLRHIFTGVDNATYDIGRVLGALAFLVGLGLQVYSVVGQAKPFDMQAFGLGVLAMAGGLGAMLKLKAETEPTAEPKAGPPA